MRRIITGSNTLCRFLSLLLFTAALLFETGIWLQQIALEGQAHSVIAPVSIVATQTAIYSGQAPGKELS